MVENFSSSASVDFPVGDGWQHIPDLVPDASEHVWLIVEDDSSPFYPVYYATPRAISAVIGECYGFEYSSCSESLSGYSVRTTTNRMIGVGKKRGGEVKGLCGQLGRSSGRRESASAVLLRSGSPPFVFSLPDVSREFVNPRLFVVTPLIRCAA